MYTYNASISTQPDGSRALCTSEPREGKCTRQQGAVCGAVWRLPCAMAGPVPASPPWVRHPTPLCTPSPAPLLSTQSAVEKYGGFDFSTHAPSTTVFEGAEAVELWARPGGGAASLPEGLILRLGNVSGVRGHWRHGRRAGWGAVADGVGRPQCRCQCLPPCSAPAPRTCPWPPSPPRWGAGVDVKPCMHQLSGRSNACQRPAVRAAATPAPTALQDVRDGWTRLYAPLSAFECVNKGDYGVNMRGSQTVKLAPPAWSLRRGTAAADLLEQPAWPSWPAS